MLTLGISLAVMFQFGYVNFYPNTANENFKKWINDSEQRHHNTTIGDTGLGRTSTVKYWALIRKKLNPLK